MKSKPVTIIVPVYADWASLKVCIESLKNHVGDSSKIMLVNDCGPKADELETKIKQAIKGLKNFEYHRNKKNLGFVKNCNNAVINIDNTNNDIMLLNSDTKVTPGFLEEMKAVLYSDKDIAVVSPRSNNATLATVPLYSASTKGISPKKSYKLFLKIKAKLPKSSEAPTAHGFCMLIKREVINKYGLFDEKFGKGYGEEVDYCQKLIKAGYKCTLSNRAFVFHMEARSFSHAVKTKLLEENNKIIWERYPDYRYSVRRYMEAAIKHEEKVYPKGHKLSFGNFKRAIKKNTTLKKLLNK